MKLIFHFFLLVLLLTLGSCSNQPIDLNKEKQTKHIDTLNISESYYEGCAMNFTHKTKTKKCLPKNDSIFLKIESRSTEFKDIVKYCHLRIESLSDSALIRKIDDSNFVIFIKPEFDKSILDMDVFFHPKKNVVLKTYFTEGVTKYPDYVHAFLKRELIEK